MTDGGMQVSGFDVSKNKKKELKRNINKDKYMDNSFKPRMIAYILLFILFYLYIFWKTFTKGGHYEILYIVISRKIWYAWWETLFWREETSVKSLKIVEKIWKTLQGVMWSRVKRFLNCRCLRLNHKTQFYSTITVQTCKKERRP